MQGKGHSEYLKSNSDSPCQHAHACVWRPQRPPALTRSGAVRGGQYQNVLLQYWRLLLDLVQYNTEAAMPFFVSTAGYGLLWDNCTRTPQARGLPPPDGPRPWPLWPHGRPRSPAGPGALPLRAHEWVLVRDAQAAAVAELGGHGAAGDQVGGPGGCPPAATRGAWGSRAAPATR